MCVLVSTAATYDMCSSASKYLLRLVRKAQTWNYLLGLYEDVCRQNPSANICAVTTSENHGSPYTVEHSLNEVIRLMSSKRHLLSGRRVHSESL